MVVKYAYEVREDVIPFTTNEDIPELTSGDVTQVYSVPVYYTDWVELVLNCTGHAVTVDIVGDMLVGVLPVEHVNISADTTIRRYILVKGAPLTTSIFRNSHYLKISYTSFTPGSSGKLTGTIRRHGIRRG